MTTREIETDTLKCHRYWPEADLQSVLFGSVQVTHVRTLQSQFYVEREFRLSVAGEDEVLEVVQLCYLSWPDHVCVGQPSGVGGL
jgi:protein tyrosine phosphatase